MKPLCIDLFTGLHGWAKGFLAEGYRVIGFDLHDMCVETGHPRQGGDFQLVLQDVLTLHGSQFRDAACIVASPPCQTYSWMAMPWSRAKARAAEYRDGTRDAADLTRLFDACFRIQREACEAAGRHIPMVAENVKGAQPWVGRAKWHYGSYFLWGDVPVLMPSALRVAAAVEGLKQKDIDGYERSHPQAFGWKSPRTSSGATTARKAASAQIAMIPFELSRWIARTYKPVECVA